MDSNASVRFGTESGTGALIDERQSNATKKTRLFRFSAGCLPFLSLLCRPCRATWLLGVHATQGVALGYRVTRLWREGTQRRALPGQLACTASGLGEITMSRLGKENGSELFRGEREQAGPGSRRRAVRCRRCSLSQNRSADGFLRYAKTPTIQRAYAQPHAQFARTMRPPGSIVQFNGVPYGTCHQVSFSSRLLA